MASIESMAGAMDGVRRGRYGKCADVCSPVVNCELLGRFAGGGIFPSGGGGYFHGGVGFRHGFVWYCVLASGGAGVFSLGSFCESWYFQRVCVFLGTRYSMADETTNSHQEEVIRSLRRL